MNWETIDTCPQSKPGPKQTVVLCAFEGQYGWVYFTAFANGSSTHSPGYASPTHWTEIEPPDGDEE